MTLHDLAGYGLLLSGILIAGAALHWFWGEIESHPWRVLRAKAQARKGKLKVWDED